jgi:hypothetical protein
MKDITIKCDICEKTLNVKAGYFLQLDLMVCAIAPPIDQETMKYAKSSHFCDIKCLKKSINE